MDISKYNLSEIFHVLEEEGIHDEIIISSKNNCLSLVTKIDLSTPFVRKINSRVISNLKKATKEIRGWLNRNGHAYDVKEDYVPIEEGVVHTIDIEEIN